MYIPVTIVLQEPVTRQVTGPKGEPATIILINEHSGKMTPDDLSLHPSINESFSPHQRTFTSSRRWLTQTHNWSK